MAPKPAVRAFRSAVSALSPDADLTDVRAPTVSLCAWDDELGDRPTGWLEAPDADVVYYVTINDGQPLRMHLGAAPIGRDMWELECKDPAVRVPAAAGERIKVFIEATARDGALRQTLVRGSYIAPDKLMFMGAPGHLVPLELHAGSIQSHMFVHVLNIEGRGYTCVCLTAWLRL